MILVESARVPPQYTARMTAERDTHRYTYELIEPTALATAALRREWDLLDRNVCGIREIEPSVVAARITILDAGVPDRTVEAAYYSEIEEFGITGGPGGSAPTWLAASNLQDGIERWLRVRGSGSR